jgi:hypothetical protein
VAGVAAQRKTIVAKAPKATPVVATAPKKTGVAPVAATRTRGTLPFTGAELAVFAVVGVALIGCGFVLRMTARRSRHT